MVKNINREKLKLISQRLGQSRKLYDAAVGEYNASIKQIGEENDWEKYKQAVEDAQKKLDAAIEAIGKLVALDALKKSDPTGNLFSKNFIIACQKLDNLFSATGATSLAREVSKLKVEAKSLKDPDRQKSMAKRLGDFLLKAFHSVIKFFADLRMEMTKGYYRVSDYIEGGAKERIEGERRHPRSAISVALILREQAREQAREQVREQAHFFTNIEKMPNLMFYSIMEPKIFSEFVRGLPNIEQQKIFELSKNVIAILEAQVDAGNFGDFNSKSRENRVEAARDGYVTAFSNALNKNFLQEGGNLVTNPESLKNFFRTPSALNSFTKKFNALFTKNRYDQLDQKLIRFLEKHPSSTFKQ